MELTAGGNFGGVVSTGGQDKAVALTDGDGWATSPPMWTNTKSGTYQVVSKILGPAPYATTATITINNQPDAAAAFAWVTQPSASAVAGTPFTAQPSLVLADIWGNPVNGSVTVTATADNALGLLQGTTSVQALNGQVTSPTFAITRLR